MCGSLVRSALAKYVALRVSMLIITIFVAYTISFLLIKFMPLDAVEYIISHYITSPAAQLQDPVVIESMKKGLYEIFGLEGSLLDQYRAFLVRLLTFNFGPSVTAFPTSVSELLGNAIPWTVGLLSVTTVISWVIGNVLGVFVGHSKAESSSARILLAIALVLRPMPYYILALVFIFLFVYLLRLFPLPGGGLFIYEFNLETIISLLHRFTLPALSLIIINIFGWWFLSSYTLTLNVINEDFYHYGELRGLKRHTLMRKYVLKNIMLPQVTTLGLSLGGIFGGSLITESIFALPGLGTLLYRSITTGDIITALGVLSLSILAVSIATFILDIIYPLIDPRVRTR